MMAMHATAVVPQIMPANVSRSRTVITLVSRECRVVRSCQKLLDDAQLQVKKIMTAPDGSPVEEDFQDEP